MEYSSQLSAGAELPTLAGSLSAHAPGNPELIEAASRSPMIATGAMLREGDNSWQEPSRISAPVAGLRDTLLCASVSDASPVVCLLPPMTRENATRIPPIQYTGVVANCAPERVSGSGVGLAKIHGGILARRAMRPELRDAILATADEIMQAVGGKTFEEGVELTCWFLETMLALMNQARTREQLARALDHAEIPPNEEQLYLASLRSLPQMIRSRMRKFVKDVSKDIPGAHGGRKHTLNNAQKREVCAFIGGLYGKGVALNACKQRAARRFGVGVRTVERAWQDRAKVADVQELDSDAITKYVLETLASGAELLKRSSSQVKS